MTKATSTQPSRKPKQYMSSFDIAAIVTEFKSMLGGGFINKVYQPVHDELVIRINVPKSKPESPEDDRKPTSEGKYEQKRIFIKVGKFIYIAESDRASGSNEVTKLPITKSFAMLLRKYLGNGKIIDISQYEFDRLIEISIQKQYMFKLIIEMFGNGNVILTKYLPDEDNYEIVQPLFPKTWRARELRAGESYEYPPKRVNILTLTFDEFQPLLMNSKSDLVRTLAINVNLGGLYAEEICKLANIDKSTAIESLSSEDISKLYNQILNLQANLTATLEPMVVAAGSDKESSKIIDVIPFDLKVFDVFPKQKFDTFNGAVHEFFSKIGVGSIDVQFQDERAKGQKTELERLTRQLSQQREAIKRFEQETAQFKIIADAIYANYKRCQELLDKLEEWQEEFDWAEIVEKAQNLEGVQEINPYEGYMIISVVNPQKEQQQLSVKLDYRKDINANAADYYEKSKKSKEKLASVHNALISTEKSLKTTATKLTKTLEEAPGRAKLKRRKTFWFEKYRWFISSDGNLVIAGKDAGTNDKVVKKHLKDFDRYAHADIVGAPSVIIKRNEDEEAISDQTLEEACRFAVIYSKAWNSKLGSASAYWVKPDQVSKTPPPGEFLPRGAFMIRGKHNFHHKLDLEIAVGEIEYEGETRLMGGPLSAITARAEKYLVLVPGELKKSTLANKLSKIYKLPTDEILKVLPPGNVKIVKTVGFELKIK